MARPRLISDEQILDATRAAVNQFGPGVSLDLIAGNLGVSQPALLKRFGSRNKLMVAALKPAAEPAYAQQLRAGPDDRPLCEQLQQVVGWLSSYFEENAPRIAALRESGIPMCDVFPKSDGEPPPLRIKRGVAEWLHRARAMGLVVGDYDIDMLAVSLVSTVASRHHTRHLFCVEPTPRVSDKAFLKSVTDFFACALTPASAAVRRARALARRTPLSRSARRIS